MPDTTTPSVQDQINAAYAANFGRAPEAAGAAYWTNIAATNPGIDLGQAIAKGAQGADQQAEASLAGKGSQYVGTDNSANTNFNANGPGAVWNTDTNQWSNPTPAVPAYSGPTATAASYTATPQAPVVNAAPVDRTIDPATGTVQGQISGIIAANSPLMQQAKANAQQQMNDRGLINSSIAVGAGQNAVLTAATPIAASDAGAYNTAASQNQAAANTANLQNSSQANQVNANNAGFTNTASQFSTAAQNAASIQNAQNATQQYATQTSALSQAATNASNQQITALNNASAQAVTKLTGANQVAVQNLISGNQQLLQTNQSAASMVNQYVTNLTNIDNSTTMDADAKQAAADSQLASLNAGLQAIGAISGLDLSKYFKPATTPAATTTKTATATAPDGSAPNAG